ncbi:prostaglandin D2 synthase b, tandem duplicate 1 isoform X2 [Kryptolebias marmoratus]|uniref:prostaglandin D2 synthase b, tandem duplicate 1 isoform X2 n=1 Tax=Kryptolebias marmoratus TaxID=37003 RepID=UPI0007F87D4F|nr:prostaglandin D2 synthase b, tandem duplicate 1 isoform X2 [Kryptolebias marmoratus]
MRTAVLRMMAALMCVVAVCADVMPMQDFSLEKMAGKWYLLGFASNAQWFVEHRDTMKAGTAMFTPTEVGDLDLSYSNLNTDGTCWRMTHLAKKTDTPGRFTFHSQAWNNDNDMRIVDVVYDNYALTYTIKTKEGVSEVLIKLYSRSTEVSADLQQKFTQFSQNNGVLTENIVILPKNECPEAAANPAS